MKRLTHRKQNITYQTNLTMEAVRRGERTIYTKLSLLLAVLALCAVPCLADWCQAESPDFVLDTTIPEPALIAAAALPLCLLLRRKCCGIPPRHECSAVARASRP